MSGSLRLNNGFKDEFKDTVTYSRGSTLWLTFMSVVICHNEFVGVLYVTGAYVLTNTEVGNYTRVLKL